MNKKFIASFTLFAFLSLGVPAVALDPGQQGLQGTVEAQNGRVLTRTDSGWAELGTQGLTEGAVVRTAGDSEVVVKFPGETRVRLAANTDLRVVKVTENGVQVALERGRLLGSAQGALTVQTARSVTRASEGDFVVRTTANGTRLDVLNGNASLSSDEGVGYDGLESLPGDIDSSALSNLDNLNAVQSEGEIALDMDQTGQDDDDEDEGAGGEETNTDNNTGGGGDDDSALWVYGGAGALVIGTILLINDDDDDEVVGNPSPSLP